MTLAALPTTVAPDGSPVAVYLALPAHDEAQLIHRVLAPAASVLELGCGTGRVTQWLAEHNHNVVAIDQSIDMLKHVVKHANVMTLRADIETLKLDWKFDGVVLPSYLVNTADSTQRAHFLATCRRHVTPNGVVVIQRVDPKTRWIVGATSFFGPVRVRLLDVTQEDRTVRAQLEYNVGDHVYVQTIQAEILDDATCASALHDADLRFDRWLDTAKTWFSARPLSRSRARSR